jgi:hypothetical protein
MTVCLELNICQANTTDKGFAQEILQQSLQKMLIISATEYLMQNVWAYKTVPNNTSPNIENCCYV